MNKLFIATAFSLSSIVSGLHAQSFAPNYWFADDCSSSSYRSNACCVDTSNSCCVGKFGLGADWLYWKIDEDNLEFAAEVSLEDVGGDATVNSDIVRPKFKSHTGYRIYGDYTPSDSNWVFSAIFSHAPTSAHAEATNNVNMAMDFVTVFSTNFPLLTAISAATFDSVDGTWSVKNNFLDLDVIRVFELCDTIRIRPHMGLRGFWATQNYHMNGVGEDITFTTHLRQKNTGFGLEGGLWGDWSVWNGFSIVGHVGGAAMYTKFRNHGTLEATADDAPATIRYNDSLHRSLFMVDTFIGLNYDVCLRHFAVNMHVGWEQHLLFDINQFSLTNNGNMTLQGLTLGGGFRF